MKPLPSILNPSKLVMVLACLAVTAAMSHAQTARNWNALTPGSYNWFDTANWSGGNVPDTIDESAQWNATGFIPAAGSYTVDVGSVLTVGGISMSSGTGATAVQLTLTGSQITLSNNSTGLATVGVNNVTGQNLAIANDINAADAQGILFNNFRNIKVSGAITGSTPIVRYGGNTVFLGGANSYTGTTELAGSGSAGMVAIATNAFSGLTGQISHLATANGFSTSVSIGSAVSGTTTVNAEVNLNNSAFNFYIGSGGTGSVVDLAGNLTGVASGAGAFIVKRSRGETATAVNVAAPTGTGTVKFSGTGYTVAKAVTGSTNESSVEFSPASGSQTWNGAITAFSGTTGTVSVIKSGAGTVTFGGANTYQSQTLVSAGTLLVNGTHIDSAAVTTGNGGYGSATEGHFKVANGATLGGTGRIVGNSSATNSNMVLVQSGGVLAPGDGIGALTLDGTTISGSGSKVLNMASGSKFSFELGAGGTSDNLNLWNYLSGDLALNSNVIDIAFIGEVTTGTYNLFNFYSDGGTTKVASGISSGLTLNFLTVGAEGHLDYTTTGEINLVLTTVPEPSTWALLALGLTTIVVLRRRRMA